MDTKITFQVQFQKNTYNVEMDSTNTVADLKNKLLELTQMPVATQKLVKGGILKDNEVLSAKGFKNGTKVMLVASSIGDIMSVSSAPTTVATTPGSFDEAPVVKEPLCRQETHKKVISKGPPEDAEPATKIRAPLPSAISGLLTKTGKVRMTFKVDQEEVWIGSASSTQKLPFASISKIISEPIDGHDGYHIMGLQLGKSDTTVFYLYFVPEQYVNAIKDTILGTWGFF
eukprot:TRINITY_DN2616_c0_g1_i1.p1 TRINITY_DN2616_c0_g1~~TRINITY_DN2616_c0_g1_i1.p1  ORF type:complete len:229 (-),score=33.99 TRINITY_DN2616_c0_g1_i1:65-751(-)